MDILAKAIGVVTLGVILMGITVFAVQTALDLPHVYKRGSTNEIVYIEVVEDGRLVRQPPDWLRTYKGPYEVRRASPNQRVVLTKQYL